VTAEYSKFAHDHDSTTHNHLPKHLTTTAIESLDQLGDDNMIGCHHSCASGINEHHNEDDVLISNPHTSIKLDPEISNHPGHNASATIIVNNDNNSTGDNSHDHKSLLDAILNNHNSRNTTLLSEPRNRAESWGGMSDLSHAAAIMSAGTTIDRIGTTIIGGVCTASNEGMEGEANSTSSNVILNDTTLNMTLASSPSVATPLEVYLSSPRSMNYISGCGISMDGAAPCSDVVGNVTGDKNDAIAKPDDNDAGSCAESNTSLGIAALEECVDLISNGKTKIDMGDPDKVMLEILELGLDEAEEEIMAMVGRKNSDENAGFWRHRCDSMDLGSTFNGDRIDSMLTLSPSRKDSFAPSRKDSFAPSRKDSFAPSRKDSFAAAGSLSGILSLTRDRFDSLASLGECSMSITDLADVAGRLESVVADCAGAQSDDNGDGLKSCKLESNTGQNPSAAFPPPTIQVDSDAVQAAVQAAMAATSGNVYDMLKIGTTESTNTSSQQQQIYRQKQALNPSSSNNVLPPPLPSCSMSSITKDPVAFPRNIPSAIPDSSRTSETEMEAIRARARAAAGYVPPTNNGKAMSTPSLKRRSAKNKHGQISPNIKYTPTNKRPRMSSNQHAHLSTPTTSSPYSTSKSALPTGVVHLCGSNFTTPKRANTKRATRNNSHLTSPLTSAKSPKSSSKGQSEQKWEEMFQCLVAYVEEQKQKEIEGMTKEETDRHLLTWEWSGNVPTMYKRKDGKALGRWINNQRSAKSKGTLKRDREGRLISTGLKWSVLTTNAWTDMMEELRIYVREQTKNGGTWNGNVPTNYKIKSNTASDGSEIDEDKNLGRWINRQRSLYQADKLKRERQVELEKVGLKWAVLSTTSWHAMYDTLCKYAQGKRDADKNNYWDGNVPASYETDDKPPKRLGRWVNRQRSAYATNKLKKEFVVKLEKIGLKWTAHDKKLLIKVNGASEVETTNIKGDVARAIATNTGSAVLLNVTKNVGQQLSIQKQGQEPTLFLNGKGHGQIAAAKLSVVPGNNISNPNNSNSELIIGL